MTPERSAELRALAEAATPGPWEIIKFDGPMSEETICRTKGAAPYEQMVWREGGDYDDYGQHPNDKDAAFIAAARTALPEALDAIERVRTLAMLGGEPVMTYQQRPVHVVPCSELLAALEGKQ